MRRITGCGERTSRTDVQIVGKGPSLLGKRGGRTEPMIEWVWHSPKAPGGFPVFWGLKIRIFFFPQGKFFLFFSSFLRAPPLSLSRKEFKWFVRSVWWSYKMTLLNLPNTVKDICLLYYWPERIHGEYLCMYESNTVEILMKDHPDERPCVLLFKTTFSELFISKCTWMNPRPRTTYFKDNFL